MLLITEKIDRVQIPIRLPYQQQKKDKWDAVFIFNAVAQTCMNTFWAVEYRLLVEQFKACLDNEKGVQRINCNPRTNQELGWCAYWKEL